MEVRLKQTVSWANAVSTLMWGGIGHTITHVVLLKDWDSERESVTFADISDHIISKGVAARGKSLNAETKIAKFSLEPTDVVTGVAVIIGGNLNSDSAVSFVDGYVKTTLKTEIVGFIAAIEPVSQLAWEQQFVVRIKI